jgi:hypothetical protein
LASQELPISDCQFPNWRWIGFEIGTWKLAIENGENPFAAVKLTSLATPFESL